jgi:membrane-associated phospholipid phosphatase/uncharacterized protein YjbJ (UPF0337 family)
MDSRWEALRVVFAARFLSVLGGPAMRAVMVGLTVLALLLRRRWRAATVTLVTVAGAGLMNSLVKHLVQRQRPVGADAEGYSFPSGHATGALALQGAAIYIVWRITGERVKVWAVALGGAPLAALIGLSRIRLHEHRIGDVLGGYALGAAWLIVASRACAAVLRRNGVRRLLKRERSHGLDLAGFFLQRYTNRRRIMKGTGKKAEGSSDKVKGKLQHAWGELTDNDEMKAKGRQTKAKGTAKKAVGRIQNAVDALKG